MSGRSGAGLPAWLWVALGIGLLVRILIIGTVPLHQGGEGPPAFNDELSHLQHIRFLTTIWDVPEQRMNIGHPAAFERGEVEYHQPPLYYMAMAGLLRVFPFLQPWQVPVLRSLSLLLWIVAMWILLRSLPDPRWRAPLLFAGSVLAVSTQPSAYISNDGALAVAVAGMYALSSDLVLRGWSLRQGVMLGLTGALGVWCKLSALTLWPMLALAAWLAFEGRTGDKIKAAVIPPGIAFIGTIPLWLQRTWTYGEPMSFRYASEGLRFNLREAFAQAYHTLVAPWMELFASLLVKGPALVFLALLLATAAYGVFRRKDILRRLDPSARRILAVWLVGAGLSTLAWLVYGIRFHQTEARLLLPAAPGLAVLFGWPLWVWKQHRANLAGWGLLALATVPWVKWGGWF